MMIRPSTPLLQHSKFVFVFVLVTLLASVGELRAQALIKVPFPYSPINSSSLPWMIAKDAKVFEKHGSMSTWSTSALRR